MELLTDENKRRFGDDYIRILIKELKSAGKDSSGKLVNSLDYRLVDEADSIGFLFQGENYLKYVDEGRRSGSFPPLKAIGQWARTKGISQKAVFPIAKSIYKFGIKPTNVMAKTQNRALNGQPFNELEENMAENLENMLVEELEKLNNK